MTIDRAKLNFYSGDSIDKIVKTYTGSFSAPDSVVTTSTINHGLGRATFLESYFSTDGTNYYPAFTVLNSPTGSAFNGIVMGAAVSSTQLKMYANNNSGSTRSVRYKVMLIWPT